jgi:1-acyl-sn-glycerol-3-phosphate acyltransferase
MKDRRTGRRQAEALSSPWQAAGRLFVYLPFTLVLLPVQMLVLALDLRFARRLPLFYHRLCCRMLGFKVKIKGRISTERPTLFVANHISYIDIIAFGSILEASFIAKAEISDWPLFGRLAKLQRTLFIKRQRQYAAQQRDEIGVRLGAGDNLILFPEGTSCNGQQVLPFKSALFSVVEQSKGDTPLTIQPVSVAYTQLDGIPLRRALRPHYAWYGDMTLVPHLIEMLGIGKVTIEINFHEPVPGDHLPTRKALADYCYRVVGAGVDAANSGRPLMPEAKPAVAAKS